MAIGPWGGFSNGAIPASALSRAGGVLLRASTAAQCNAWIAACARRGVALEFNEGYRDLAGQRFWLNYYGGDTRYAAWPGTSNHGWGQAVDINANAYSASEMAVIVEEGARFGMLRNIALESWHFADVGTVTASLDAAPFDENPTNSTGRRKRMEPTIITGDVTRDDAPFIFDPYTAERKRISAHQLNVYRNSRTPPFELRIPQAGFDTIPKVAGTN